MDTFNQTPLLWDPKTKSLTSTTTTPTFTEHLSAINALHKTLTSVSSDAQDGVPPPPTTVNPKRSAQVTKLKDSANTAFRAAKYADANRMYSLAIDMAAQRPLWEPSALAREELSQLYSNRAMSHMSLGNWAEGAVDAQCSVECKKQGNPKAWWRRGRCLVNMGRLDEAQRCMDECLELEAPDAELVALGNEIREKVEKLGGKTKG
jgi:translocation protein SEC72